MKKLTEQDCSSLDVVNENLESLKAIFPEAFTEDGVDFEMLRQLLGNAVDDGVEKYGLTWHGKKKARQIALMPSLGTLRPCPEESVDWDTTQNLFIEGDNLEVLKLLQKSYANKVKMIYIDPPYNTGKEFIYPDKFQDNLDTYLKYTGQKDDEGFKVSSNTESSGRYHTNWLNMMYPRLKLARNLLCSEGILFISIDDTESSNLRGICNEVFGEENYLANIAWKHTQQSKNDEPYFSRHKNDIIVYRKSQKLERLRFPRSDEDNKNYSNPDNDPNGDWRSGDVRSPNLRETLKYEIETPSGHILSPPEKGWRWSEKTLRDKMATGEIVFSDDEERIIRKIYLKDQEGRTPENIWAGERFGTTRIANSEIKKLFEGKVPFDTAKPTNLIRSMMDLFHNEKVYVVLDFFAGSSSAAHAVFNKNQEDGGNRKYIMVQLPEPCDEKSEAYKAGYKTIAEIGKERIRRAAAKIKEENPDYQGDLGFKIFKLDSSNIRAWSPDRNDLGQTLLDHMEHLVEGRSEEDVLYELLLKRGVDLTVPIEEKTIVGKTVYSIGYGVLFACLDTAISREEVEDLAMGIVDWHKELEPASDTQVVFRDSAFANDIAKTNMTAILEQHGIAHVRSL
jgi:adenine-specific DNA-methyltransferase